MIPAYSNMLEVTDPTTGQPSWVIALQAHCSIHGKASSAWYLTRNASGEYQLHEVPMLKLPGVRLPKEAWSRRGWSFPLRFRASQASIM